MDDDNPTPGRSKRIKKDKFGRNEAFERLKQLKGTKNKYEIIDEKPLYEEVSEKEYSKIVRERQEDDWIIDDDGTGYVEDGREVFDDDDDDVAANGDLHAKKKQNEKIKKKHNLSQNATSGKFSDIKSLLKAQPVKRKTDDVKFDEDDDLLGNILDEVHNDKSPIVFSTPKPMVLTKKPKKYSDSFQSSSSNRQCINPFAVSPKFPIASSSSRNHIMPKVVNFDNAESNEIMNDDFSTPNENSDHNVVKSSIPLEDDEDLNILDSGMEDFADLSYDALVPEKTAVVTPIAKIVEKLSFNTSADVFGFDPNNVDFETTQSAAIDVYVEPGHLPLTAAENGESVFRFFWFDAYEDSIKHPGVVYLFGKTYIKESKSYVSCCIVVRDIQRRIFILPRETHMNMQTKSDTAKVVTMQDVYTEISAITKKMKITEFKTKKSTKNYAFDNIDIPDKCDYLELQYSAKFPPFPSELCGATFSYVLGTDTSSLEVLLMDQKIKGPGWLDVSFPQVSNPPLSWCKIEAAVNKVQHIVPVSLSTPPPPMVVMSLSLTTVVNAKTHQNEIAAISCLYHSQFQLDKAAPKPHFNAHFCVISKPSDCIFPYDFRSVVTNYKNIKIECVDSERALLAYFLAKLHKIDPDVIVGHDVLGFDMDVLLHRFANHKIPNYSRIGRLRRTGAPRVNTSGSGFVEKNIVSGRLLCDIKISAKELIRCRSYDLVELANHILDRKFEPIQSEDVRLFYSTSNKLLQLLNNGMVSAEIILAINCELNILPLALQITNIAGCVMSRTLLGGRSERNEFLLLHAFLEKNYIPPPKVNKKYAKNQGEGDTEAGLTKKQSRRKPAYEGGLVLDPKIGFYDKYILLMDFNSLYPSIIQEYNICFTTLERSENIQKKDEEELSINMPKTGSELGVLPDEIRKLVQMRRDVKQMMKNPDLPKDKLLQFDIRQRALKLTANSMYGCLGFSHSRFYAKTLAALVTRKGREILMKTKELVDKMGLDVIYGDTDSIMINTNQTDIDAVTQLGNKVKSEVNKLYRLLEIDIDGIYKSMLLLKKKKYAALSVNRLPNGQLSMKEEMKGLDIVRRDWSQLAKSAGEFVIKQILSTKSKEEILDSIHSHLDALGKDIASGNKPVTDFVILKQLTKAPENYPDKKSLPHVLVALRMNEKSAKRLKQNDTVPYIICTDGTDLPNTQRAYHPDEMKANEALKIDVEYYLSNQVHPVISRLCGPIEGTDAALIAKLLGLNPSKYVSRVREEEEYEDKILSASSVFDDADRFDSCDKLVLRCPSQNCSEKITVDAVFKSEEMPLTLQLNSCPKCKMSLASSTPMLCNQLHMTIRRYINKYYKRILQCEDVGCAYQSRRIPLVFNSGGPICPACQKANLKYQFSESQLYAQMAYFCHLFDTDKALSALEEKDKCALPPNEISLYNYMKSVSEKALSCNGYGEVNLAHLFSGLFAKLSSGNAVN